MKKTIIGPYLIGFYMSSLMLAGCSSVQTHQNSLSGPYLGQTPPGNTAEKFAPNIISTDRWELEGVFAPGMNEFYYTVDRGIYDGPDKTGFKPTVIGYRQQGDIWYPYTEFPRTGEIGFSADGNTMHMAKGYKIRQGNGWSKRKSLGPLFDNNTFGMMRLSASAQGTYVFDDYLTDRLHVSVMIEGQRQTPRTMGGEFNQGKWTAHPFIAPDEDYIIWDSEREDGFGETDLYISFKQANNTWGKAVNMGPSVNSTQSDFFATVTPDGKYILFNRKMDEQGDNIDIFWVSTDIIKQLRGQQQ